MTLSLRARLFLAFAAVTAIALGLSVLLTAREEPRGSRERAADDLERTARLAAAELRTPPTGDWPAVADRLGSVIGLRVTLIDSAGRVIGDSGIPREQLPAIENHAAHPEVRSALGGRPGRAVLRSETTGEDQVYVAVPSTGMPGIAALRITRPVAETGLVTRSLGRHALTSSAIALAMMLILIYGLTGRQAARVADLEDVAERVGAGDTRARARETPADELGRLGGALNRMTGELRARLAALENERDARERTLAHMSDGVALVDPHDRVVYVNRSLALILGSPLPPEPGTPFGDFARDPELVAVLTEARAHERTVERELSLWSPQHRRVHVTGTRLTRGDGAVVLVVHDLTEIELLNRVRQDFVANVSHELKTPLTSVRGYAETLLDGGLADPEHREDFVRVIRDQAVRLEAMVDDLLALADLERPDARLRRDAFDLREAGQHQVGAFEERAHRAGLGLELEPGPPEPVVGDRGRLEQVMANLLDNALKYTEDGGVRVRLGGDESGTWFEVRDTGAGIAEADLPRIFERFYRVDKARSREQGGTGLGLSIVKHIVTLHGGAVAVESRLGTGSTFRVTLPRRLPA